MITAYFLSQITQGYYQYDWSIRSFSIDESLEFVEVQLDVIQGFTGFAPSEIRYTFTYRRLADNNWYLFNVREYRMHLLAGFSTDTFDDHPIIIVGNSEPSKQVGLWLAEQLDTIVVPAQRFTGTWNDAVIVDCMDNPLAAQLSADPGVTVRHDQGNCHRFAIIISADSRSSLQNAAEQAVSLIRAKAPPTLPADPVNAGDTDRLQAILTPATVAPDPDSSWLATAALSDDPGSTTDYVQAVLKWYRFLLRTGILDPAIIVANIMSEQQIACARTITGATPDLTLRNLALFAQAHLEHQRRLNPDHSIPFGSVKMYPANPSITWDEMLAFFPEHRKAYGMCGPLQYFNMAVLLLSGIPEDDMVQVRILAGQIKHELLCLTINADHYLCSGIEYLKMSNNFYRFSTITHVFNAHRYRSEHELYTISDDRLHDFFSRVIQPISQNFVLSDALVQAPSDNYRPDLILPPIDYTFRDDLTNHQLAEHIRDTVFQYSHQSPHSHYTYAKYAYQTLYVSKPETYALASTMGPLAARKAKEMNSPEQALTWIHDNIVDASIYAEGHRLQYGDQVLVYGRGTSRDRAMLGFALLHHLGFSAYVIIGDRSGWLLYKDGSRTRFWDCGQGRYVSNLHEPPIAIFNLDSCYFPTVGRMDLDAKVMHSLGL